MGRGVARSSRLGGGAAHRTDSRWPGEEPWHGTLASRPCVWLLSRANERGERAPCVDLAAQLLCSSSMAPGSSGIEPQARVGALQSAPIVTAASGSPKSGVVQQSVSSRTPLPPLPPPSCADHRHCALRYAHYNGTTTHSALQYRYVMWNLGEVFTRQNMTPVSNHLHNFCWWPTPQLSGLNVCAQGCAEPGTG